jgi:hypothetical protein
MFFAPRDAKALKCISAAGEGIPNSSQITECGDITELGRLKMGDWIVGGLERAV